ncbi:NLR family CARD domain-containing protein 4 [Sceloporus undulatus]|uniref:NLR family CARD domain-containing protein 4 n=1 Tax=Sceloporus undulatus TaxID=8520 RepID=UPI001C4C984C|nr:NLR family CARD domain-containing protein 4 [Sceloporus undulatus]
MIQEDFDCLVQDLINFYKYPLFEKFHPLGEEIDIIFDLTTTYTDTLLWKKDIHNIRLGQLSLKALLDELKNPCIIEGEAGKGKTTLLKKIALLWANGDHPSLTKFKLVFFISLSGARGGLYETVCEQLLTKKYRICKEKFMEILGSLREKALFLLDGYDEFKSQRCPEIESLIKENYKFKNTVIVTTRTESISSLRLFGSLIAETGDLTMESAKQLVRNVLRKDKLAEGLLSQMEKTDSTFQKSGSQIDNLMKTPLFVVIACAIQMGETTFNPHTQTTLFSTLHDLLVGKNKYKTRELRDEHFRLSIIHCGDLALDGVFEQKFNFQPEDFSSVKEQVLLATGLMNKYTAQRLKPVYRFFHKSFQEYTAGRRLSRLLTSRKNEEVTRGHSYLQKINSISDVITTYHSLLLYTCGSSAEATKKVIDHIAILPQLGGHFMLPSSPHDLSSEMRNEEKGEEEEGLIATWENSFVECAICFLYESISETSVKEEYEDFFHGKNLYINTQNIPTYICGFFEHFSNCVSMLELIKLDFSGTSSLADVEDEKKEFSRMTPWKTVIPEKAVSLFFNWDQKLNSLEITLKEFNKLGKGDVKYLEKICCCASSLRMHISKSPGLTGKLSEVLNSCTNLQDLIIESTPLAIKDEQQIAKMMGLKTIKLKDLQNENLDGGLLDGISLLVNVEKLIFDNITINEATAKKLGEDFKHLKKLHFLQLTNLTDIGNGMTYIAKSVFSYLVDLEEIHLVNSCLSGAAVEILVQNICSLHKLHVLNLSDNFLGNNGKEALCKLVDTLNILPKMKVMMFPSVDEVTVCLIKLVQLERMPQLAKLGLKKWAITDSEAGILGTLLTNTSFRDLKHLDLTDNCMTSHGWITILGPLSNLKKLKILDFSQHQGFLPSSQLVLAMARLIIQLVCLQGIYLLGWQFDAHDLGEINKAKQSHRNELQLIIS